MKRTNLLIILLLLPLYIKTMDDPESIISQAYAAHKQEKEEAAFERQSEFSELDALILDHAPRDLQKLPDRVSTGWYVKQLDYCTKKKNTVFCYPKYPQIYLKNT